LGDLVNVKVIRIADFGVFVEILPGIEGVVFSSELDDRKIENPAELFAVGDERLAKIIRLNPKEKKISLSFRQAQYEKERMEYQKYARSQDGTATLGDIMKDQLKNIPSKPAAEKPAKKTKAKSEETPKKAAESTVEEKKEVTAADEEKKDVVEQDEKKEGKEEVKGDKTTPKKEPKTAAKKKTPKEKNAESGKDAKSEKKTKKSSKKEETND
jgi:ribosomal protein S1